MLVQHLEKLRGFHRLAVEGSVQAGARALGISQPALTKSLQSLERAVGEALVTRHSRGISLTPSGRKLLLFCERLFLELADLEKKISSPESLAGMIRVGTYETLGISFWPHALRQLQATYPGLAVQISTQGTADLWRRLEERALHLVVDAEPPLHERYYSKVLYTDRFGLFAKPGAFAKSTAPPPFSYVQRAFDQEGRSIAFHLAERAIAHELTYDFDTFVSVKAVVEEGLAVGVLPLSLAAASINKGDLVEWAKPFGIHRICATCLEADRKDPRIKALIQTLEKIAAPKKA